MNLHLRTMGIIVAITLLTGATDTIKNISIAQTNYKVSKVQIEKVTKVAEVSSVVYKNVEKVDDSWYIKEIPLTKEQQKYVVDLCEDYKFDPLLIYAVMKQESRFDIKCESETSDKGIMQINSSNFKWIEEQLGKDLDFLSFEDNVLAGIFMLDHYRNAWSYQLKDNEYKHTVYYLNSYNMGVSGFKSYVKTRGGNYNGRIYAKNILEYYKQYSLGNFDN